MSSSQEYIIAYYENKQFKVDKVIGEVWRDATSKFRKVNWRAYTNDHTGDSYGDDFVACGDPKGGYDEVGPFAT